ncbi:MAG: hypothetical protein H7Y38_06740 [Armatimonadetes bacterium]|nr:hypothetical protein [Armatimonadota bacterium]
MRGSVVLALAGGAMMLPAFGSLAFRPVADLASRRIGEWLAGQNLHDGYGEYWCGSEVTVRSRGRVRVRAVRPSKSKLEPNLFGADDRWYLPGVPSYFVLIRDGAASSFKPPVVRATFGKPSRVVVRDGYIVMIYDRDIAPLLTNRPTP